MKRNRAGSGEARIDEHVTFELASGPRHFGMPGDRAEVSMYVTDDEQLAYVGETLAQCFGELWGVEPEMTVGAFTPNARSVHRGDGEVTLLVWNNGDPSVGIGGDQASVTMWIPDEEYLGYAREMLGAAFTAFWDAPAFVMTEQEAREPDVYEPNAARRRKPRAGVKPWRVALSSAANPDIPGGYWQGGMPGRPRSVPVASFEEASQVVQDYIAEHELGGGNWTGGEITDYATGKVLGRVSYNGRVWPPGEWHSGQQALWPNSGESAAYEVWQFSGADGYEEAAGLTLGDAVAEAQRIHERTGRAVRVYDSEAVQEKYPKMPRPVHSIKAKRHR